MLSQSRRHRPPGSGAPSGGNGRQRRDRRLRASFCTARRSKSGVTLDTAGSASARSTRIAMFRGRLPCPRASAGRWRRAARRLWRRRQGAGTGGASVPDRQAGVRLRHGSLSGSGEERAAACAASGLLEPDDCPAAPVVTGEKRVRNLPDRPCGG